VACDLRSAASSRTVFLSPTPERVEDILTDLTKCEEANHLPPSVGAEALFGRLSFVMQTTVGAVGRAATQPLLQRAHEAGGQPAPFTPAIMRHMLRFFRALPLLPSIPPLALRCEPARDDDLPPVVVYTDASYCEAGWSGLGIIITDGDDRYEAGCRVPQWLLEWLRPRGQQINHLEAIAIAAARLTFPDVLLRRRVLHFVDNTVALSGPCRAPPKGTTSSLLLLFSR
jgi:hypothetical protein